MNGDKINAVNAWFKKAENDLRTAEYTMTMDDPPYDTVCFHAQQCAEKYMKGFLTFHEIDFPKTHSIEDLVLLCKDISPSLESEIGDVEVLSIYAVEARYPSEMYYEIPEEKAYEAIEFAKKVNSVVLKHLEGKM
ncbi:MAG: HEPN domain-containing protein [Nitrospirae bacterium]|nr:HEPN domain-containing protein [Nitrospirota bacterium]